LSITKKYGFPRWQCPVQFCTISRTSAVGIKEHLKDVHGMGEEMIGREIVNFLEAIKKGEPEVNAL